ncbi:MAG: hypothetical protein IKT08_00490 [Bacteroidales bacterium]|nr:hypothetical protein [Bacteroidales bacterium]
MRIVILSGTGLDVFHQAVLKPILDNPTIEIVGAYIDGRPRPSLKKRFKKNLKRGRGGYMLVMLAKSIFGKKEPTITASEFFASLGIDYVETQQPYSKDSIAGLLSWSPDAMVMLGGFGIVKEPLLSLAPQGILSYHHGDMRKYRGQPVGFWELYHNESQMGVTVQRLSAGIDKGTPIVEQTIPIEKGDDVKSLCERAMSLSTNMMAEALQLIEDPAFCPSQIQEFGPIFTLPNLRQYMRLKIKLRCKK